MPICATSPAVTFKRLRLWPELLKANVSLAVAMVARSPPDSDVV